MAQPNSEVRAPAETNDRPRRPTDEQITERLTQILLGNGTAIGQPPSAPWDQDSAPAPLAVPGTPAIPLVTKGEEVDEEKLNKGKGGQPHISEQRGYHQTVKVVGDKPVTVERGPGPRGLLGAAIEERFDPGNRLYGLQLKEEREKVERNKTREKLSGLLHAGPEGSLADLEMLTHPSFRVAPKSPNINDKLNAALQGALLTSATVHPAAIIDQVESGGSPNRTSGLLEAPLALALGVRSAIEARRYAVREHLVDRLMSLTDPAHKSAAAELEPERHISEADERRTSFVADGFDPDTIREYVDRQRTQMEGPRRVSAHDAKLGDPERSVLGITRCTEGTQAKLLGAQRFYPDKSRAWIIRKVILSSQNQELTEKDRRILEAGLVTYDETLRLLSKVFTVAVHEPDWVTGFAKLTEEARAHGKPYLERGAKLLKVAEEVLANDQSYQVGLGELPAAPAHAQHVIEILAGELDVVELAGTISRVQRDHIVSGEDLLSYVATKIGVRQDEIDILRAAAAQPSPLDRLGKVTGLGPETVLQIRFRELVDAILADAVDPNSQNCAVARQLLTRLAPTRETSLQVPYSSEPVTLDTIASDIAAAAHDASTGGDGGEFRRGDLGRLGVRFADLIPPVGQLAVTSAIEGGFHHVVAGTDSSVGGISSPVLEGLPAAATGQLHSALKAVLKPEHGEFDVPQQALYPRHVAGLAVMSQTTPVDALLDELGTADPDTMRHTESLHKVIERRWIGKMHTDPSLYIVNQARAAAAAVDTVTDLTAPSGALTAELFRHAWALQIAGLLQTRETREGRPWFDEDVHAFSRDLTVQLTRHTPDDMLPVVARRLVEETVRHIDRHGITSRYAIPKASLDLLAALSDRVNTQVEERCQTAHRDRQGDPVAYDRTVAVMRQIDEAKLRLLQIMVPRIRELTTMAVEVNDDAAFQALAASAEQLMRLALTFDRESALPILTGVIPLNDQSFALGIGPEKTLDLGNNGDEVVRVVALGEEVYSPHERGRLATGQHPDIAAVEIPGFEAHSSVSTQTIALTTAQQILAPVASRYAASFENAAGVNLLPGGGEASAAAIAQAHVQSRASIVLTGVLQTVTGALRTAGYSSRLLSSVTGGRTNYYLLIRNAHPTLKALTGAHMDDSRSVLEAVLQASTGPIDEKSKTTLRVAVRKALADAA